MITTLAIHYQEGWEADDDYLGHSLSGRGEQMMTTLAIHYQGEEGR